MLLVHLFVCFARVCFCHFSLPLGVDDWMRFVIVLFFSYKISFLGLNFAMVTAIRCFSFYFTFCSVIY